jgi:hypothetical protein
MKIRYYVSGIGYDENDCVTDYEYDFGDFDTYEEAYELFVKLQCRDEETFFIEAPEVDILLIQVEVCEETDDAINCIEVKNELWIENPNFKVRQMDRVEFVEYVNKNFNVSIEFLRLLDHVLQYAERHTWSEDEIYDYLYFMLDCGIGLTEQEIKQIVL